MLFFSFFFFFTIQIISCLWGATRLDIGLKLFFNVFISEMFKQKIQELARMSVSMQRFIRIIFSADLASNVNLSSFFL